MNGNFRDITGRLAAIEVYRTWFARLYADEGISRRTILAAIATYERTIVSGWAPFDRWVEGDETAISASAKRGFELFNGEANCAVCHSGWNLTDNQFHDTGLPGDDVGRLPYEPDNEQARFAFKTPGLRNLTHRAPFMHDGSLADLAAVIAHYEAGGIERPSRSHFMVPVELDDAARQDLLSFLVSLTADQTRTSLPILPN
jgi:cytochrome c peroxidase